MGPKRILQIIPADRWQAVFKRDDGSEFNWRLACWALVVKEDGSTQVEGMYAGDFVDFCEVVGNFSHYLDLDEMGADDGRE